MMILNCVKYFLFEDCFLLMKVQFLDPIYDVLYFVSDYEAIRRVARISTMNDQRSKVLRDLV